MGRATVEVLETVEDVLVDFLEGEWNPVPAEAVAVFLVLRASYVAQEPREPPGVYLAEIERLVREGVLQETEEGVSYVRPERTVEEDPEPEPGFLF